MAEVILETERLVLRREMPGDYEAWLEHLNTPQVTAFLGGPRTPEEVAAKFEKMARGWAEHGFSFMMVTLRESDAFVGTCGIGHIDTDAAPDELRGAVQIGWTFRADQWGKGLAIEAARSVMDFAFGKAGLETVYSQTSERNRPSWRVMEKLGMERRADLDYSDPAYPPEDNPTVIYAIGRAAWRAQSGKAAYAA